MSKAILQVQSLDISFGGVHAVNNVSFNIEKGEILGLIGPNGAGKSTVVNLISGVLKPDSGDILFEGSSISQHKIHDRAKLGIGRTFQSPKPFSKLTVFDSILTIALQFYSFEEARKKSAEILERTHMSELSDVISEKLPIEKRKWLDLARVLALSPKLILMDEVMAGLNPQEMEESLQLVKSLNEQGITVLFIEHVMKAVVSICHRVIVLNGGMLLTEGPPLEVMQKQEVINAYLGEEFDEDAFDQKP